jgi:hypothetical protein
MNMNYHNYKKKSSKFYAFVKIGTKNYKTYKHIGFI